MRKFILGLALASSVLGGGVAMAQSAQTPPHPAAERDMPPPPPHHGPRGFMRADANNDGIVTREEARAEAERMFAERDTNRDGRLTSDEMRPRHHARRGGDDRPRANANREVSQAQFERRAMRRFDRLDADKDGRVAKAEIRQHRMEKREQRQQRTEQQG
jgi:hypothetical protein